MMITDRTLLDVTSIEPDSSIISKGAYNYTDLNRVEAKVKELNDLLVAYNYMSALTTKLDWTMTDKFNQTNATRYLNNIKAIRSALATYSTTPVVPSTMVNLTYDKANDIEKILVDIENLLVSTENWFIYSGVSNSGQLRYWQNRFRQFYEYPVKLVNYIESLGSDVRFDTGVKCQNGLQIVLGFQLTEVSETTTRFILGTATTPSSAQRSYIATTPYSVDNVYYKNVFRCYQDGSSKTSTTEPYYAETNTTLTLDISYETGNQVYKIYDYDGTEHTLATFTASDKTATNNIILFGRNGNYNRLFYEIILLHNDTK